jgi:cytochrome c peroxidase
MRRLLSLVFSLGLLLTLAFGVLHFAFAQGNAKLPAWVPGSWSQALEAPLLPSILNGATPASIPQFSTVPDASGQISTYEPGGAVTTSGPAGNAFFQSLGTNGRSCFSCHQPENGWSITPRSVAAIYYNTQGRDPLFSPVDGSNCPNLGAAAVRPGPQFIAARSQLFNLADFRIFLPVPAAHDWISVTATYDPTGCESSPVYGLPAGMASFYRRPLPSGNTNFILPAGGGAAFDIMWDAREASLQSQFLDATRIHAQATPAQVADVTGAMITEGVTFQNGNFTAQSYDLRAGDLTGGDGSGAQGGPIPEAALTSAGVHAPKLPLGCGAPPAVACISGAAQTFDIFNTFDSPEPPTASQRASIQRGQTIFNTRVFTVTNVRGLNDAKRTVLLPATCASCHNVVDVGNDFFDTPKDTGVMDSTSNVLPPGLNLPIFTFLCPLGSLSNAFVTYSDPVTVNGVVYDQYQTTDPGVGWISGKCADLGRMKVPVLRGLAGRAPYFHGGNVSNLTQLVQFYNQRFNIGLSEQDASDLINFLNSL